MRNQLPRLRLTLNAGGGGLKSQLKRADHCGARYALILGDDEAAKSVVQVKSLRGEGEPFICPWTELPTQLVRLLGI